jgi:uroporphyrinogen-III synthase
VENLVSRVQQAGGDVGKLCAVCAACIGPKTADTAKTHAFTTILVPSAYTLEGLVESLVEHFMPQGEF